MTHSNLQRPPKSTPITQAHFYDIILEIGGFVYCEAGVMGKASLFDFRPYPHYRNDEANEVDRAVYYYYHLISGEDELSSHANPILCLSPGPC